MAGLILKFLRLFPHVLRLEAEVEALGYRTGNDARTLRDMRDRLNVALSAQHIAVNKRNKESQANQELAKALARGVKDVRDIKAMQVRAQYSEYVAEGVPACKVQDFRVRVPGFCYGYRDVLDPDASPALKYAIAAEFVQSCVRMFERDLQKFVDKEFPHEN